MVNFKRLVNAGADVNIQTRNGETPISSAGYCGRTDKVEYLLKHGANINLGHRADGSSLVQACRNSHFDTVKLLVEHKADLNQPCEGKAGTPLAAACVTSPTKYPGNCEKIVRYLLENGADVNGQGGLYGYPLTAAAYAMPPSIVGILLEKEARVDVRDTMGRSPIHLAALHGVDNLQTIIDAGGDIKATDATQRTALHWAAAAGRAKAVERILSLSSDEPAVDARDIDGWTPLCWAARGSLCDLDKALEGEPGDQLKVIHLLLEHGAQRCVVASLEDKKWTPLKIARFSGAEEDVLAILEKGIDGNESTEGSPAGEEYETKKANQRTSYCDFCHCVSTST
jgi:ankyrin repeat protein